MERRIQRLRENLVTAHRLQIHQKGNWVGSYVNGLYDAYCVVTGQHPDDVTEWLMEAADQADQQAHDEMIETEERWA
jgi:hypothetical protein